MSNERLAEPQEDDFPVQRIEIEFAIPVYLPIGFQRELDGLLTALVNMRTNQLREGVHWVSGHGAKPLWSQADARFLGKAPADDAPRTGEPRWDDTVYHIETTARPFGSEKERQKHDARYARTAIQEPE